MARTPGSTILGVPIGQLEFVQVVVTERLHKGSGDSLLCELSAIREDTQLAVSLLLKCYVTRAIFLARNIAPSIILAELQRFDERTICALAAIMQEPITSTDEFQACINHIKGAGWDPNTGLTQFTPAQVHRIRLSHKRGGMGMPSMVERSPAAFVARIGATLELAIKALPATPYSGPSSYQRFSTYL